MWRVFNGVDKVVRSMICESCSLTIGCERESTKLEKLSVGPLLPETIGRSTGVFMCILVSVYNSGIRGGF